MTEPDVNKHYPSRGGRGSHGGECSSPGLSGVRGSALSLRAGAG